MTDIIVQISNHLILQKPRAIKLNQIRYIDFVHKQAQVIWDEVFLNNEGQPIIDETVSNRPIVSIISNENKVTAQGIVIDETTFPIAENETQEDYLVRIETMKQNGFPEFDFYINAVINTEAIQQAILILDSLKRFDRK
jgi:hypothetical protein